MSNNNSTNVNDDESPYKVLGVDTDASASQIKTAYRKLALRHHPDRQSDEQSKIMATQIFSKISNAYEIVGDDARRQEYDQGVASMRQEQQNASAYAGYPSTAHSFHDPFDVFAQVFGNEFRTEPSRRQHQSSPMANNFFQQQNSFGSTFGNAFGQQQQQQQSGGFGNFFGNDPFFGGDPYDGGGGTDPFSQMNRQMAMMRQQQMGMMQQAQRQSQQGQHPHSAPVAPSGGGYSSFYSSSSNNFGSGSRSESVSTSTRMINGKRQTVTERVITNPDGTTERHVETTGDDEFPVQDQPHLEWQRQRQQLPASSSNSSQQQPR